jgi:hypothetical protein
VVDLAEARYQGCAGQSWTNVEMGGQ